MFKVEIDTTNSAFEGNPGPELARILTKLAEEECRGYGMPGRATGILRDHNGNRVGAWTYDPAETRFSI